MVVKNPLSTPKVSWRTLTTGATQLVVQEALEMRLCWDGSYMCSLTPRTMVTSSFLAGALMTTFLTLPCRWAAAFLGIGEFTGGFHHHLYTAVLPGDVGGVLVGRDTDALAVNDDGVVAGLNMARERAVVAIVLEKVSVGLRVSQIINRYHLQLVGVEAMDSPENLTASAAEAIDSDGYGH